MNVGVMIVMPSSSSIQFSRFWGGGTISPLAGPKKETSEGILITRKGKWTLNAVSEC